MKLELILDKLNSFEKNSFLKIIDDIIISNPRNIKGFDKILSDKNRDLKSIDSINIAKVFQLLHEDFTTYLTSEFISTTSQLDILVDIISRDGNCIMSQDWFSRLYEREIKNIKGKVKELQKSFEGERSTVKDERKRDYSIYKACLNTAYTNDDNVNLERKITNDEQSILLTLANQLELSQEEIKLINYSIVPIQKQSIDDVINDLKKSGVIFYSKKLNTVYVADEIVRILRKLRGKEVADKFFRRVLRLLREPQINLVCRKHNIDWRLPYDVKVKEIINEGISFSGVLVNDMHKEGTNVTSKKKSVKDICDKGLRISPALGGIMLEDKISNLIKYFEETERDEKVGISFDGYEKLLFELNKALPNLNVQIKQEFELQNENALSAELLLDYNIKPRDVLELIPLKDIKHFSEVHDIKARGDLIPNILDAYKDSQNLYLENFENIGYRDIAALKENGIQLKESEIGIKFEDLTKTLLMRLGFNVDEKLRKKLNTKKDKIDILINLGNNDVILIECKTVKESGYNKFSSVSRQLRAYANLVKANDYKVIKSLLIAPEFSDDFVNDCELEYELNLSLITALSLHRIYEGLKGSRHKKLPYKLLMRDVLIHEQRILRALKK